MPPASPPMSSFGYAVRMSGTSSACQWINRVAGKDGRPWRDRLSFCAEMRTRSARRLEQEPGAALRLIDPVFNQAGGCIVIGLGRDFMGGAKAINQRAIIGVQLHQHVASRHKLLVVV